MKKDDVKPKGKGVTRALIASKREGVILKKDNDRDDDVVMRDAASKRKRALSKSKQV